MKDMQILNESSGFAPALGVTNLQMPDENLVVICFDTDKCSRNPPLDLRFNFYQENNFLI
jgi:hypothetical protein